MKDSKVSFNKNISKNLRHHSQLFVQCVSILANKKKLIYISSMIYKNIENLFNNHQSLNHHYED